MTSVLIIFAVTAIIGMMIGVRLVRMNKRIDDDIRNYLISLQWDEEEKE
jgi:hypothetical protein